MHPHQEEVGPPWRGGGLEEERVVAEEVVEGFECSSGFCDGLDYQEELVSLRSGKTERAHLCPQRGIPPILPLPDARPT